MGTRRRAVRSLIRFDSSRCCRQTDLAALVSSKLAPSRPISRSAGYCPRCRRHRRYGPAGSSRPIARLGLADRRSDIGSSQGRRVLGIARTQCVARPDPSDVRRGGFRSAHEMAQFPDDVLDLYAHRRSCPLSGSALRLQVPSHPALIALIETSQRCSSEFRLLREPGSRVRGDRSRTSGGQALRSATAGGAFGRILTAGRLTRRGIVAALRPRRHGDVCRDGHRGGDCGLRRRRGFKLIPRTCRCGTGNGCGDQYADPEYKHRDVEGGDRP